MIKLLFLLIFSSCTMTFQNVNTIGTNSDVIDDEFKNDAAVTPTVNVQGI